MVRNYSYLDHRYPIGFALYPSLRAPGSMPRGGGCMPVGLCAEVWLLAGSVSHFFETLNGEC